MSKRNLLIIGGSYEQKPLIKKAQELGYTTIVIDLNEEAPGYLLADHSRKISTTDIDGAIKIAKEFNVIGVLTNSSESAIVTVAEVSKALSLPGIPVEVAECATDKELMKKKFKEFNLPTSDYIIATSLKEAKENILRLNLPAIIKPVDGAGSRGVLRIDNIEELDFAFNYSINYSKKKRCIIEEFVEGIELSSDSMSYNGETEVLAISDKEKYISDKNYVAMNIVYQARFSQKEIFIAKELIKKVTKSVGIKEGPSHTEIIRKKENDFVVIETAARGGGFFTFSKVVPTISGLDTLEQIINLAVGKPVDIKPKFNKGAVLRFLTADEGKITSLSGLEEAKKVKGVIDVGFFLKVGDIVKKIEKDGDRIGYMIITGKNAQDAIQISDKIVNILKVEIEPNYK